eukprot:15344513-Ditylum_brightwellii.AAC.1
MALLPHSVLPEHNILIGHHFSEKKANRYPTHTCNSKSATKNGTSKKLLRSNIIWLKVLRGHRPNALPSILTRIKNNRSNETCKSSNKNRETIYYYNKMSSDEFRDKHSCSRTRFGTAIPRRQMAESNDKGPANN